eukprot:7006067-Alexandrium_andersonii.AAC.1
MLRITVCGRSRTRASTTRPSPRGTASESTGCAPSCWASAPRSVPPWNGPKRGRCWYPDKGTPM